MAIEKRILNKLKNLNAKKINSQDTVINQAQKEFLQATNRIDRQLAALIGTFKQQGSVPANKEALLARLVTQKRELRKVMVESGYFEVAERFIGGYEKTFGFMKEQFGELGIPLQFTEFDLAAFTQLQEIKLQSFAKLADDAVDAISTSIHQSVIGSTPVNRIVENVSQTLDATMKRHTETIVNTSLGEFDRTVNGLKAADAGIETFIYVGPNDRATRDFCNGVLSDQDSGKGFFTREEISLMINGQGLDVFTSGGGWNCRHEWVAVPAAVLEGAA